MTDHTPVPLLSQHSSSVCQAGVQQHRQYLVKNSWHLPCSLLAKVTCTIDTNTAERRPHALQVAVGCTLRLQVHCLNCHDVMLLSPRDCLLHPPHQWTAPLCMA